MDYLAFLKMAADCRLLVAHCDNSFHTADIVAVRFSTFNIRALLNNSAPETECIGRVNQPVIHDGLLAALTLGGERNSVRRIHHLTIFLLEADFPAHTPTDSNG